MQMDEGTAVFHFDGYSLDTAKGIVRAPGGAELELRPKTFALLRYLVERPGQVLDRADLLDALWPNVIVTDDSLTQCVSNLRQAFGSQARRILRTISRRGYMLSAKVEREAAVRSALSVTTSFVPPTLAELAIRRRDTLVVHPIEAPGGDPAAIGLAQVLTSDLAAELIRFEDLRVLVASGATAADGYYVRGEVHLVGTQFRVTVRLEDAASGDALWADRLDQPPGGQLGLPVASVVNLAARIDLQVGREGLRRSRQKPPAALTSREFCLLGRDFHQRGTKEGTRAAQQAFSRAVAADPDHAVAHAWHAFTVMRFITHGWGDLDWQAERKLAVRLARRAVDLEPESPLCRSSLAFALALGQQWEEAVVMARLALRTGRPADFGTRTSCGEVLAGAGHPEEAVEAVRKALALDPHCPPRTRAVLGRALLLAGQPEEALSELRWCAAQLPDYAPCFRSIVVAAVEIGRIGEACTALNEVQRLQPNWIPGARPVLWFLRYKNDVERFLAAFRAAGTANIAAGVRAL